jgi:hypothetical protein
MADEPESLPENHPVPQKPVPENHPAPGSHPKPENPALAMLLRLEARVEGLAEELMRVKGRLAYVEARLATLEAECEALAAQGSAQPGQLVLNIPGIAPPLSPGEDVELLNELVREIRARRTPVRVLSDDERAALEEALRFGVVSEEEADAFRKRRGCG